ncbi:MAG: dTMP kinase [Puniceicoccales bacterium]|jgi:dTMP kinase|nr:dTMP kinase [Puniceicoccales bacterium]
MQGKIISFEGIEGTGKSTQVQNLKQFLCSKNIDAISVREPGNTPIGERIRHLLQHEPQAHNMCPETELLLYEASRAQLIHEVIIPALNNGQWVICDRFFDSSTAYQGAARQLPTEIVKQLNHFAVGKYIPDLSILLDIDVSIALQRLHHRKEKKDRIERESVAFFKCVRDRYLQLAIEEAFRFFVIDGALPVETIAQRVCECVQKHFAL